jgi:hypothetical protein
MYGKEFLLKIMRWNTKKLLKLLQEDGKFDLVLEWAMMAIPLLFPGQAIARTR